MNRTVYRRHLLLASKIVRYHKDRLANRTYQREGRIEYQSRIGRSLGVLIGIRHRDRTNGRGKASSHAGNTQGNGQDECHGLGDIIGFRGLALGLWHGVEAP